MKVNFHFLILGFLSLAGIPAFAQQFSVSWADESRLKYKFADIIPVGEHYLAVKKEEPQYFKFGAKPNEPTVLLLDKNLSPLKENKLSLQGTSPLIKGLFTFGKNVFLLYDRVNFVKNIITIYAVKINRETLMPVSESQIADFEIYVPREIELNPTPVPELSKYVIKFSADSTKVLLYYEGLFRKKDNKKLFIGVYDTDLKTIWKRNIEFPFSSWNAYCYDYDLMNDGRVIVSMKHYDQPVGPESAGEEPDKVPSYSYKFLSFSSDPAKKQEVVAKLNNYFIEGTILSASKEGGLAVSGLYKRKYNGNAAGVFYANLNENTLEMTNPRTVEFPPELLSLVEKDKFGKSGNADPGLFPSFKITHVLQRKNGSNDLIIQYLEERVRTFETRHFDYFAGDIITMNTTSNNKTSFTRIPLDHSLAAVNLGMGCLPVAYNDKLAVFYNDNADNIGTDLSKRPHELKNFKNVIFAAAIIDAEGNVSKQVISKYPRENYLALPSKVIKLSVNKYMLLSGEMDPLVNSVRFGILEIK